MTSRSSANCSFAAATSARWPSCGGLKLPPKRPTTGPSPDLELVVADLDKGAAAGAGGLQRAVELVAWRRLADDAEAAVGAKDPEARPPTWLRPVDEVVGQLLRGRRRVLGRWRDEREERPPERIDAFAGRAGE